MLLKAYSIYDNKALVFIAPFFLGTHGMAVRAVVDSLGDPSHPFSKHPGDYVLFYVGTFDDGTGVLEALSPALNLGVISSFKE